MNENDDFDLDSRQVVCSRHKQCFYKVAKVTAWSSESGHVCSLISNYTPVLSLWYYLSPFTIIRLNWFSELFCNILSY